MENRRELMDCMKLSYLFKDKACTITQLDMKEVGTEEIKKYPDLVMELREMEMIANQLKNKCGIKDIVLDKVKEARGQKYILEAAFSIMQAEKEFYENVM